VNLSLMSICWERGSPEPLWDATVRRKSGSGERAPSRRMFFGPIRSKHSQTLRNEAKRSVSKGGNTHYACTLHCNSLHCVLRVATLRDTSLRSVPPGEVGVQPSDERFTRSRDEVEPTLDDGKWLKCECPGTHGSAVAALAFDRHSSAPHSSDRQGRTAVHSLRASGGPLANCCPVGGVQQLPVSATGD
jgi:hypothetical protein